MNREEENCADPLTATRRDGEDQRCDGPFGLENVQGPSQTMWLKVIGSFSLEHGKPHLFLVSPWDGGEGSNSRKVYLVYRYSSALYFAAWLLVSWSSFWDRAKWFIYLTHWAFACLVLDQSLQTLLLLLNGSLLPLPVSGATGTYKTLWVVGNVSSAMALSATFGFWVFLYDGSKPLSAITLHTHGVNAVFVLVDTLVSARPCRLAHAFHPVLAALCYVSFTGVYWLLGGRGKDETPYVYPVLNWTHGARTLGRALGLCFVGVTAMHVPRWAVTKCRDAFFRRRRRLPTGMSSPGTVKV